MTMFLLVPGFNTPNSDLWERHLKHFTPVSNFYKCLYQINPILDVRVKHATVLVMWWYPNAMLTVLNLFFFFYNWSKLDPFFHKICLWVLITEKKLSCDGIQIFCWPSLTYFIDVLTGQHLILFSPETALLFDQIKHFFFFYLNFFVYILETKKHTHTKKKKKKKIGILKIVKTLHIEVVRSKQLQ